MSQQFPLEIQRKPLRKEYRRILRIAAKILLGKILQRELLHMSEPRTSIDW